ncbi:anthranilate phosphoribosyltransferase [Xylanibacillus composti]|uniref:Anthranilate phosphoribosyltransferase n=1 Tax=Xylanibacillus composti TaxID=1572762 RepID=A0A8J4M3K8_9BACL|nr:anthranilate phosphoribosyltransferase [Xylanibacillus composti]GIQ70162.1 anthranilate phosphoribosyltransferase [Xylanibacillus composti]
MKQGSCEQHPPFMHPWIKAVGTGKRGSRDLAYDEAVQVARLIATNHASDVQIAAFLMALRMKGESDDEIMALVDVFREYAIPFRKFPNSINCAGPYDGRYTIPFTIPVSLLLASVGIPHVLHGGKSLPPKRGTAIMEVLGKLGVNIHLDTRTWESIFSTLHIGFVQTERICPPIARVRALREEMGLRTVINTVEKVVNPVHSNFMMIGVNHQTAMDHLIHVLSRAGFIKAYIVQGIEGSEDLPLDRRSAIRKVTAHGDEASYIDPRMFGFQGEPVGKYSAEEQVRLLRSFLEGEDTDETHFIEDHVVFNAGLRFFWYDRVSSYEDGFQLAKSLLRRKEPLKLLRKWTEQSRSPLEQPVSETPRQAERAAAKQAGK